MKCRVWLRCLCLALTWSCHFAGLAELSFSIGAACCYDLPDVDGDAVFHVARNPHQGAGAHAILPGRADAMTILQPGRDEVPPMSALPLLAGCLCALAAGRCRRCRWRCSPTWFWRWLAWNAGRALMDGRRQ